jgi:hypothetical protein
MSAATTRPLSLRQFDFDALYTRHLGRHSQLGINVAHLLALYGLWFGIYAPITQGARLLGLPAWWAAPVVMAVAYLAVVCLNGPPAVTLVTAAFMALFVASVLALPPLPVWAVPLLLLAIPACYKLQSCSHKVWTTAAEMSEFNRRIPPGRDLNIILLFYEVPICLNYLVFRSKDWRR